MNELVTARRKSIEKLKLNKNEEKQKQKQKNHMRKMPHL